MIIAIVCEGFIFYNEIIMDDDSGSDILFQKGLTLLRGNNSLGALACFEKAYIIEKTPALMSYLGLCIATERGLISEGMRLCREAIEQEPDSPLHYLNLGKVYLKAGRKTDCLDVLRKGISCGDHPEISALLENIGMRKPAIFSFVSRGHFLNRYAGLIMSRLRLR